MKSINFIVYLVFISVFMTSCKDDDITVPNIEVRDRGEQQEADSDSLIDYLSSHYYNSDFFLTGTNHKYSDIVITELAEGEDVPAGHTLLIDAVETHTTTYEETDYEYYVLRLNQGGGESPRFTDQVRVRYEGFLVETGVTFDGVVTPVDLLMQGVGFTGGVIRGWQLILPQFSTSIDFAFNNGIVEYNNYGLGMMFLPSGLAYFSGTASGTLSAYSNLIFKFELLQYEEVDHDGDGIPSYIEDFDANLDVLDDDTDEDLAPNYVDVDDDNDGVNTLDELMTMTYLEDNDMMPFSSEEDAQDFYDNNAASNELLVGIELNPENSSYIINTLIMVDSDNNGTPDYLQEDISINYNDEEEG